MAAAKATAESTSEKAAAKSLLPFSELNIIPFLSMRVGVIGAIRR